MGDAPDDDGFRRERQGFGQPVRSALGNGARDAIAEFLARDAGHDYVPPGIWAQSGRMIRFLRAAGFRITRDHRDRQSAN